MCVCETVYLRETFPLHVVRFTYPNSEAKVLVLLFASMHVCQTKSSFSAALFKYSTLAAQGCVYHLLSLSSSCRERSESMSLCDSGRKGEEGVKEAQKIERCLGRMMKMLLFACRSMVFSYEELDILAR